MTVILNEQELNVKTTGDVGGTAFDIVLSRKMFKILSADLYSDKVKAVIRELSTNAADSHIAAGKNKVPFEVHLPNMMEPYFEVKDFGTGLSEDAMLSIYTKYGKSDKTTSNEVTGCLGLGSKSPFAYTDSFSVESRFNGVSSIYSAYLNERGFPTLSKPLTQNPTTECNGLTVKFSVKANDFGQFKDKAVSVLKWFKVRPKVTGNFFTYPAANEYMVETPEYCIRKVSTGGLSNCIMGNVAYPIDTAHIVNYTSADDKLRKMLEWGIDINVKIGDVEMTASRESLSYDEEEELNQGRRTSDDKTKKTKTVPFIRAKLAAALVDMEKKLTAQVTNAPTLWEARELLYSINRSFIGFDFKGNWGGKVITTSVDVPKTLVLINPATVTSMAQAVVDYNDTLVKTIQRRYSGRGNSVYETAVYHIKADGTKVFIKDCKDFLSRLRLYIESTGKDSVYLLPAGTDPVWLKETGLDTQIIQTSTLPKPERTVTKRGTSVKSKMYEWKSSNGNATNFWVPVEVDMEDDTVEAVYVEILRFKYKFDYTGNYEPCNHPEELKDIQERLTALTGKTIKIYGIRPADRKLIDKSEGTWTNLLDYIKKAYKTVPADIVEAAALHNQLQTLYGVNEIERAGDKLTIDANGALGKYLAAYSKAKSTKIDSKAKAYGAVARLLNIEVKEDKTLQEQRDAAIKHYPLIRFLNSYYRDDNEHKEFCKALSEYVNVIDKK